MSDIQGDRPDDSTADTTPATPGSNTPDTPAAPVAPSSDAPQTPSLPQPAQPASAQPAQPAPVPPVQPVSGQPAQPSSGQPVPPVAGQLVAGQPVPPVAGQPAHGQPVAGQPAHAQPVAGQPAHAQPVAGQPAPAHPVAGQPAPGQPPAGHPLAGQPRPVYGQYAAPGQAFGMHPNHPTQPTTPLPGAPTGTATTKAPDHRGGAGRVVGFIVAAALVGGAAGLGGAYAGTQLWATHSTTAAAGPTTVTVNSPDSVNATTAIAAKVVPSVVTIEATSGNEGGTGSGVVLTSDGYVVTNTHVVTLDGATGSATLRVTTSDGHVYDASVVGTDPIYDLAVIKLKGASGLTPIDFGDSSKLNVGDQTVAIGAPLGLSNSVTTGIVSALNRSIEIQSSAAPSTSGDSDGSGNGSKGDNGGNGPFYFDFGQGQTQQQSTNDTIKIAVIQTDAAINPGNSGGALVDSDGKLIGINVAIASAGNSSSSSGQSGSIGVGFSIPSDIVKRISDDLMKNGTATHGLLGASVGDAASVSGSTITGAYISSVTDGGAAQKAGLQKGDIVTAFNGVPVTDAVDLTAQVRAVAGGGQATVTYVRDGQSNTVTVTLGTLK